MEVFGAGLKVYHLPFPAFRAGALRLQRRAELETCSLTATQSGLFQSRDLTSVAAFPCFGAESVWGCNEVFPPVNDKPQITSSGWVSSVSLCNSPSQGDDVELNVLGCRVDILGTNCDQCVCMVQCYFTSTETIRLIRTGNTGRPPQLSHSSWTLHYVVGDCFYIALVIRHWNMSLEHFSLVFELVLLASIRKRSG